MNNAIDEIKAKLSIEELVGQYVQLKKVGRSLKGLCPFHQEKTPSFIVSPDKGIAYCFGCNKGGDIFRFIQEVEGVDFNDALKILAERTGVKLEEYKVEKAVPKGQKDLLMEIYEKVAGFYEKKLWDSAEGKKVLEYLHKRGLNDESIKLFRLGFAPDSFDETYTWLLRNGFDKKELVMSGMAMTKETTLEKIYDRFRGRLMFPIFDSLGRVVAFGGRALIKDQEPKYLNSSESAVYHKGHLLYGFSHSKQSIKQSGEVVIVEGYMDLIAAFQAGVKNVVATSGTALTVMQLRLLSPLAKTLYLSFDMDLAGREAAKRAYELSRDFEFEVKVTVLPEGKDPAEYAMTKADELNEIIRQSSLYGDYFYSKLVRDYGTDSYSAKKKILQEFLPFFVGLRSNVEKDEFVRKLALDLDLKEVQVYDEIRNFRLPLGHPARQHGQLGEVDAGKGLKKYGAEELLLGFLIEFPRVGSLQIPQISEDFFSERGKPIYKALTDAYNGGGSGDFKGVFEFLPYEKQEEVKLLSLFIAEKYGEMSESDVEKEIGRLVLSINKSHLDVKVRQIQKSIAEAERNNDKELRVQLLAELNSLLSTYGAAKKIHNPAFGR